MKPNLFLILISAALAALIGYLAFNVADEKDNNLLCGIGSVVCFIATLIPTIGLKYESSRLGTNIRVLSAIFFVLFLFIHFGFAVFGIQVPYYVITNGIVLVLYLLLFYKMHDKDV